MDKFTIKEAIEYELLNFVAKSDRMYSLVLQQAAEEYDLGRPEGDLETYEYVRDCIEYLNEEEV